MLEIEELQFDLLEPPWVPNPPRPRARPDQWKPYWAAIARFHGSASRYEPFYDSYIHDMPEGVQ